MAEADFIPAGRTSRLHKENAEIQIQTEYAYRPSPRLTTSVISRGQVIHKIQQQLDKPITNVDERLKIERMLQRQHFEIMEVVKSKSFSLEMISHDKPRPAKESLTVRDKLAKVNGVVNVFTIDNKGNFESENVSDKFKKYFKPVFKNILEVMSIFSELPGGKRETGIVEVERRRLYLVSCGSECHFVLMDGLTPATKVEEAFKQVIYSN
ncbi:MAG: hypothetical protein ABIJ45_14815 [Candidatus Zixiibacteriota bacterium]